MFNLKKYFLRLKYFPYLFRTYRLVLKSTGNLTYYWLSILIVQAFLPASIIYFTKKLIDNLVDSIGNGLSYENILPTIISGIIILALTIFSELSNYIANYLSGLQSAIVEDHINDLIHEKSSSVDLEFYESAEFFDHLHRAKNNSATRPIEILENSGSILRNGITLLSFMVLLISYNIFLPLALLTTFIPAFIFIIRNKDLHYNWYLRNTEKERRSWYLSWLLTGEEVAQETRLFNTGGYFRDYYNLIRRQLRTEKAGLEKKEIRDQIYSFCIGLFITISVIFWMFYKAFKGIFTLGDVVLLFQTFNQSQAIARSLLLNAGKIYSDMLYVSNLFEFLELENKIKNPSRPKPIKPENPILIGFNNVTFKYPGSERSVLENFNLEIEPGKLTAIVGLNGSGKTTLFKLICRFYDPDKGSINFNNTDIREYKLDELRSLITAIFQEPIQYNDYLKYNVSYGDIDLLEDLEYIKKANESSTADEIVNKLPDKHDTILGKGFLDGTELSVGEWQRVALSRTFFKNSNIVLLDEPTSSMDSWTENKWVNRLKQNISNKTVVIITHRFTTAMHADEIFLMKDGNIIESGSHIDLINSNGMYSSSWKQQIKE